VNGVILAGILAKLARLSANTFKLALNQLIIRGFARNMSEQSPAQQEMAALLVEALNLEDISPADIEPDAPLFGEGLGLDSIDALEIALAISQKYGVQIQAEDEGTRSAFATLAALTDFVAQHKTT